MFRALLNLHFLCLICGLACNSSMGQSDLSHWQSEGYPNGLDSVPNWSVAENSQTVTQTTNSYPAFLVSDVGSVLQQSNFRVRIEVGDTPDDDFFGFALGFQPGDSTNMLADYLLVDWKRRDQEFDGALALAGLAVSRVTGVPTESFPNFWDHSGKVVELQRASNLGNAEWENNVEYEFEISVSSSSLVISVNGVEEFNLTGNFNDGRLAFYSFANNGIDYSTDYGLVNLESWLADGYPNAGDPPANWSLMAASLFS